MARTVLPIAGAIIGGYFGGPQGAQIGAMIGSLIGNAIDPLEIQGPKPGEAARQTTQDGAPRPIIYGKGLIGSNIIAVTPQRLVEKEEQGPKGGGPVVTNTYQYQTGCFRLTDHPIIGITMIKANGKIVYDVRPGSEMLRESKEFEKRFRLHLGGEDQLPDPSLEAHFGVGTTCPHRGTANIVFFDFDQTPYNGVFPQFEFEVVASSGTTTPSGGGWFFGPVTQNGAAGGSMQYAMFADTLEELPGSTPRLMPITFQKAVKVNDAFFIYSNSAMRVSFDKGQTWNVCSGPGTTFGTIGTSYEITWNGHYYYHKIYRSADGIVWEAIPGLPSGAAEVIGRVYFNNPIVCVTNPGGGSSGIHISYDDGANWTLKRSPGTSVSDMTGGHLYWKWIENSTSGRTTDDDFDTVTAENSANIDYRPFFSDDYHQSWMRKTYDKGIIWWSGDPIDAWELTLYVSLGANDDNTVAWGDWTWVATRRVAGSPVQSYLNINRENGAPDDPITGPRWEELPDPLYGNGGNIVYLGAPVASILDASKVLLSDIIIDLCDRCGIPESVLDFTDFTDHEVTGFVLAGPYAARDAIEPLRSCYFFDYYSADGKLKFVTRGGEPKGTITEDDLLTEFEDKYLREQAEEYPRVLHMDYQLSTNNYEPIKARSMRESEDIRVTGEVSFTTPVVFDNVDEPEQIADKNHKVLEVDAQGEFEIVVGEEFIEATVSDIYMLELRGRTKRIRLTRRDYANGEIKFKARYDRQSAVDSEATGLDPNPPIPANPTYVGETIFAILNCSGLTESDDRVGLRIALAGVEPAWHGAVVYVSDDGGITWSTLLATATGSKMGQLLSPIAAASRHLTDTINTPLIGLYGNKTLESVTQDEFYNEMNGCAVIHARSNFETELFSYKDATHEGGSQYTLSTLIRGRRNTDPIAHRPGGTLFVTLSSTFFATLPSTMIGKDLKFRVIALDSDPEYAREYDFTWLPAYSQTEFDVTFLRGTRSSANVLSVAWNGRGRFGEALFPVDSTHMKGFRITLIKGTTTIILPDQVGTSFTYDATALGSGVTVRVQAINNYTGLSAASEIVL